MGVAIVYLLDWIVHRINPHHEEDFAIDADAISNVGTPQELEAAKQETNVVPAERLQKMGLMCAISIAIHNFPEGLATFIATLDDPKVGAVLAIAIAIHNIPEGIAVAFPIYYATGSKWKGFMGILVSHHGATGCSPCVVISRRQYEPNCIRYFVWSHCRDDGLYCTKRANPSCTQARCY